jgi:hypothetical protein
MALRALACLALLLPAPASAATFVIQQGIDSSPYSFFPALPRGARETLHAFTDPEGVHSFETYLGFEIPGDLLGPGEEIGSAHVLFAYTLDSTEQGETSDEPGVIECREVLGSWDEATLTWSHKPAHGDPLDVVEGIDALGDVSCDVTSLVADWVAGVRPNHGVALTNPSGRLIGGYSFEAPVEDALKAALIVETVPAPEPGPVSGGIALVAAAALARGRRAARGAGDGGRGSGR